MEIKHGLFLLSLALVVVSWVRADVVGKILPEIISDLKQNEDPKRIEHALSTVRIFINDSPAIEDDTLTYLDDHRIFERLLQLIIHNNTQISRDAALILRQFVYWATSAQLSQSVEAGAIETLSTALSVADEYLAEIELDCLIRIINIVPSAKQRAKDADIEQQLEGIDKNNWKGRDIKNAVYIIKRILVEKAPYEDSESYGE